MKFARHPPVRSSHRAPRPDPFARVGTLPPLRLAPLRVSSPGQSRKNIGSYPWNESASSSSAAAVFAFGRGEGLRRASVGTARRSSTPSPTPAPSSPPSSDDEPSAGMSILRRRRRLPGSERSSERSSSARAAAAPPRFVPARTGFASRPADSSPLAPRVRRAVPLFTPSVLPRLEAPSPISSSDDPAGSGPGPSAGLPPLSFRRSENFGRSRRTPSARRERSRAASAEMVRGLAGASCVSPSFKSASSESESGAESETAPSSESESAAAAAAAMRGSGARSKSSGGRRRPLARGGGGVRTTRRVRRRNRESPAAEAARLPRRRRRATTTSLPTRGRRRGADFEGARRGCRRRARRAGSPRTAQSVFHGARARGWVAEEAPGGRGCFRAVSCASGTIAAGDPRRPEEARPGSGRPLARLVGFPCPPRLVPIPTGSPPRRASRRASGRPGPRRPTPRRRRDRRVRRVRPSRTRARPSRDLGDRPPGARAGEASPSPHARPSEPSPASPSPGEAPPPPRVGTVARVRGAVPAAPRAARARALPLVRGRLLGGEEGAQEAVASRIRTPGPPGGVARRGAAHDAARADGRARGRASADAPTDAPSAAPPRARRAPREPARSSLPTNHDDDARGWKSSGSGHPRHSTARVS